MSLILSLSFTILVFMNFQNIIYSDMFEVLGEHNKEYIDIVVQAISFILGCFMFFFIWYSTNVFLTKRKKEIGIYVFMGLSNQKIGKLYIIETFMIGLSSAVIGIVFGIIMTQLFQMILLAISGIEADIHFKFSAESFIITLVIYAVIYLIFAVKGYINIVRSSVLDMISASSQNEYVKQNSAVLAIKTILGLAVLSAGYYLAIKEGGQEVMGNVLLAVVLVTLGVYLLFGGFVPVLFQSLSRNKKFLYKKERNLWINNVVFRIRKNYRTYAITCVLMLCSVTALVCGFAMKTRYDNMVHFRNTYTYQFLSSNADLDNQIKGLIEKENEIEYSSEISILNMDSSLVDTDLQSQQYSFLSYSQVKSLAAEAGLEFKLAEPKEDEIIKASHLYMLSLLTDRSDKTVTINGKNYKQIEDISVPYLGYFQEMISFYIVNDNEYKELLEFGEELYTYNYRIKNIDNFGASLKDLDTLVENSSQNYTARVVIDPNSNDIEWVKVLYTVCIFMFMVFILASGSILFMKLYNDAFEEKERYSILQKLGIANKKLKKSMSCELKAAYGMPFAVMSISSYFSVHALEKMMYTSLSVVHLVCILVVFLFFLLFFKLSMIVYVKNTGVK